MANPRKRPAPESSPPPPQPAYPGMVGVSDPSQLSDDQFLAWGANNRISNNPYGSSSYSTNLDGTTARPGGGLHNIQSSPSGQLVRRNMNRELTVQGRPDSQENWPDFGSVSGNNWEEVEDGDDLEERAAAAKKDALSKRPPKQLPPFIQKLSSFLDSSRNTDLIRWSDDGSSFIILDEDRFANELIPELYKHNKYPSFVRQLNMYGFHKKVGLSDNSMRASEKKARSPSEYVHPYFKRGRPELLWLIQNTKNEGVGSKKKKTRSGKQDPDSGDEGRREGGEGADEAGPLQNRNLDISNVSPPAFVSLQREVAQLQRSQQHITSMLSRLRDENNQYIRQAGAMVAQHERHENSINAILTFLATFYNRSLEGHSNLATMFANAIPANNPPQGNVVDVGDYEDTTVNQPTHQAPQQARRRPLALLPAPVPDGKPQSPLPSSATPSHQASSTPQNQRLQVPSHQHHQSQPSSLRQGSRHSSVHSSPSSAAASPSNNEDIMSVIHNANTAAAAQNNAASPATAGPKFDFDSALKHYQHADGKTPLTAEQRENVLSLMANTSGTSTPAFGGTPGLGLENPYQAGLEHFWNNREQLDMLQRLQEEQDTKMQDLADRLVPLSPTGGIPGLALPGTSSAGGFSPNGTGTGLGAANNNANAAQTAFYGNGAGGQSIDFDAFLNNFSDDPHGGGEQDGYFGDLGTGNGELPADLQFPDLDIAGLPEDDGVGNGDGDDGGGSNASLFSDGEDGEKEGHVEGAEDAGSKPTDEAGLGLGGGGGGADAVSTVASGGAATSRGTTPAGVGRVVGSVTTSSGAPSPSVKSEEEEEEEAAQQQPQPQPQQQGRQGQRSGKRRKTGR